MAVLHGTDGFVASWGDSGASGGRDYTRFLPYNYDHCISAEHMQEQQPLEVLKAKPCVWL